MSDQMTAKETNVHRVKLVAGKLKPFVKVDHEQGNLSLDEGYLEAGLSAVDETMTVADLRRYQDAEQLLAASSKLAIGMAVGEVYGSHSNMTHVNGRFDIGNTEVRATWDHEVSGRTPGRNGEPGTDYVRRGVVETRFTPRGNAPSYFNAAKDALNALATAAGDAE
jgi:hypothetical protein